MQQCSDKFGVDVADRWFTDIDCADDGVLFASNPDNWGDLLCSYETTASSMGLHTNWLKTKLRNIGSGSDPVSMSVQTVDAVTQFT